MISTLMTTLLIIDALILVFLVLILQHGNEGGLGGALGGGNSSGFFGASGGVKGIIKATWICGFLFFALSMSSAWFKTHSKYEFKNRLEKSLSTTPETTTKSPVPPITTTPNAVTPIAPTSPLAPVQKPDNTVKEPVKNLKKETIPNKPVQPK